MNRQDYNIKIAKYLLKECKKTENKDLRFHQLLFNLDINQFSDETRKWILTPQSAVPQPTTLKDKYDEESEITFKFLPN